MKKELTLRERPARPARRRGRPWRLRLPHATEVVNLTGTTGPPDVLEGEIIDEEETVMAAQSGAGLLDETATFLRRFVVLTPAQMDALALWTAHTHAIHASDTTPYISITSPEMRCGKTLLLETLERLVHSPLQVANISDAALFRAIGKLTPTLLLDEIDAVYAPKARDREELRGLLNAGYRRGASVWRMGGANMTELQAFPVFAAKAFAGIGDRLPTTLVDRSIVIRLQRRTRDETIERVRRRIVEPQANDLRSRLSDWIASRGEVLRSLEPELPDELDDRAQDVWEPLFAIADDAGADWSARARAAALELSTGEEREEDSLTATLIRDVHTVFTETGEERLSTRSLIEHLSEIEESPWGDWHGRAITPQALSKLLKVYRVRTMPVWVAGSKVRGYKREQFADAFLRVLGSEGGRSGRGGRSGSASDAAPTTPTAPTALTGQTTTGGVIFGDDLHAYCDDVTTTH